MRGRNWKRLSNKNYINLRGNWHEIQSIQRGSKDKIRVHSAISWIYKAESRTFCAKISWKSYCWQGVQFDEPLTLGTQIYSFAASHENSSDAKAAVDKDWKKLEAISAWQLNQVKNENVVIKEAQKKSKTKVHFATLMDICHLKKKRRTATEVSEVQRSSCTSWRLCQRRHKSICSFHRPRLNFVENDSRKRKGCYCKITRLWRTSSWRSIGLLPGRNEGCSKIA